MSDIRAASDRDGFSAGLAPATEPVIEEIPAHMPAVIAEAQADLPPQDFSPRVADAILDGFERATALEETDFIS